MLSTIFSKADTYPWIPILIAIALILLIFTFLFLKSEKGKSSAKEKTSIPYPTEKNAPEGITPAEQVDMETSLGQNLPSNGSIPPEVVAVITAAVVAATPQGKAPLVRNILVQNTKKPIWADTGIRQNANIYTKNTEIL